ncbi:MAG: flagellar protein FlgN [Clostridiales bacterium]|nr:flagellar protein FlgN [Clostridiales bacterium]
MENLIDVLYQENAEYEALLELSMKKTGVIVQGDLDKLAEITDEEQDVIGRLNRLETKRQEVTTDVANVLNKDVNTLKLVDLIQLLAARPTEQKKLADCHDKLSDTLMQMVRVNEQNRELIQNSLEMIDFDINMLQALKTAPETANYNKGAHSSGEMMGNSCRRFDAKQ